MSEPLRILLLEDSAADAELNLQELRDAGYDPEWTRVETESGFLQGLKVPPDLILADFSLPCFDGLRALKLLRERGLDVPFILVSGMLGEENAVEAMKQGATDYLLKDRLARLGPAVALALEQRRLRREGEKAEEAMRESEHKYRRVFESLREAAFLIECSSQRIVDTNLCAENLLGRTRTELLGMDERALFPPEEPRPALPSGRATRRRGELDEAVLLTKEGKRIPVQISVSPVELYGRNLVLALMTDITGRKQIEAKLLGSLREKEVLLREVHHRVKNNLQIVSSLLNLQSRHLTDPATLAALSSTRDRVRAMAAVHERLYESGDFAQLEMAMHLENLTRTLMRAHAPTGVAVVPVFNLEPVTVDLNTAVPLSLIANELITNALKYGFADRSKGRLTIGLRADGSYRELRVADDGPGFPATMDPSTTRTLGLRLVRDLARQIGGELEVASSATGTVIVVRWSARLVGDETPAPATSAEPQTP